MKGKGFEASAIYSPFANQWCAGCNNDWMLVVGYPKQRKPSVSKTTNGYGREFTMSKKKMPGQKPAKIVQEKKYTRAQAERALSAGMDPSKFAKHGNYHVRLKAWRKMGKPLPEDVKEANQFLVTLQGQPLPKEESDQPAFVAKLRQKFLGEAPPVIAEEAQAPIEVEAITASV